MNMDDANYKNYTKKEWDNMYYQHNKERISERKMNRPKFMCACGGSTSPDHKAQHFSTKKHITWAEEQWSKIEPII